MRLLTRREYDTRFIQFDSPPRPPELKERMEEEIHKTFPGNHGRYRTFIRSLGDGLYVAAITSTELTGSMGGRPLSIPILMLPKIQTRIKKQKLSPGPKMPLILWTGSEGEVIRFDPESKPISSRLCTEPPAGRALWCFIGPGGRSGDLPAGTVSLYRKGLPPGAGRISTKQAAAPERPVAAFFILLVVFLLALTGFLSRYRSIQEEGLRELKEEVSTRQTWDRKAEALVAEIEELRRPSAAADSPGPYRILAALTDSAPEDLSIGRFSLDGTTFTLEGTAEDPIGFSGALAEGGRFSSLDISRVRRSEKAFTFLLRGEFHE